VNQSAGISPVPIPDVDTLPFWKATGEGKLMLCRCVDTGEWIHPPQERSRRTGGPVRFEEVSGLGTIFSFIVVRHQSVPGHAVPYVVGLVELDEQAGLRLTGIIAAPPEDVTIGLPVRARIVGLGDSGFHAPEFELLP
jgi:uncharacterized OB-fold protein